MALGRLETLFSMRLATTLMGGDELVSNMVEALCKLVAFSLVSYTLIFTELLQSPE